MKEMINISTILLLALYSSFIDDSHNDDDNNKQKKSNHNDDDVVLFCSPMSVYGQINVFLIVVTIIVNIFILYS